MTNLASKLALAAALAASIPTLAHARPCDAAPVVAAQYDRADPGAGGWRPDGRGDDRDGWRRDDRREERGGWRHAQRERIRLELAQLEARRADFHATWHRRGEVRRFERWYAEERAELLGRLAELDRAYAFR